MRSIAPVIHGSFRPGRTWTLLLLRPRSLWTVEQHDRTVATPLAGSGTPTSRSSTGSPGENLDEPESGNDRSGLDFSEADTVITGLQPMNKKFSILPSTCR